MNMSTPTSILLRFSNTVIWMYSYGSSGALIHQTPQLPFEISITNKKTDVLDGSDFNIPCTAQYMDTTY
jgi:hypothetical protein